MSDKNIKKNKEGLKKPTPSPEKNWKIPAVLKYKGKTYTNAQVLKNKDLLKELIEIGFIKSQKK